MDCVNKKPFSLVPGTIVELDERVFTGRESKPSYMGTRKSILQVVAQSGGGFCKALVLGSIGVNALPVGKEITRPVANLTSGSDITSQIEQQAVAIMDTSENMQNFFRSGGMISHNQGSAGGYLVGRKHTHGGIKGINKATGQHLEVEGGEVIITAPAVDDVTQREFEGEQLTNRQILSRINESGGGVAFADGGAISSCRCSGKTFKYGGSVMSDYKIVDHINNSQ